MSKTAFVLGPEKALEIINRMPEYDAVFVRPDGQGALLERPAAAGSRGRRARPPLLRRAPVC